MKTIRLRDLAEVKHEEKITVEGKVHSEPSLAYFGRKKSSSRFVCLLNNT